MTTIELFDARDRFEELLLRARSGEQFIVTDAGHPLAMVTAAPPPPPTPEELAARQAESIARAEAAVRTLMGVWQAQYDAAVADDDGA